MTKELNIQKIRKEFNKKFPCIYPSCDNNGTRTGWNREGVLEPEQCEHCYIERLPVIYFWITSLREAMEAVKPEKKKVERINMERWDDKSYDMWEERNETIDELETNITTFFGVDK